MDGSDLTPEQRDKLVGYLTKHRDAIGRLIDRMRKAGWHGDNPTLQGALAAYHALHGSVNALPRPNESSGRRESPKWTQ
jgi:hypothetical protein